MESKTQDADSLSRNNTVQSVLPPRIFASKKKKSMINMINKNARNVGQIPIYEHFQKRSRITGANAPSQNPISNVWDILENNGDGVGAKGIKQNCNLNPKKNVK